ncbi:MAG: helix-turn-helix transcriptional regulator [Ruminiclostridium sp.]|nr:helix-turn-helix transcriptional regulator [Ruminiclostridium sp.]
MEKSQFLLYNEILYQLSSCRTVRALSQTLLNQLKLLIPYTYASLIPIRTEGGELVHGEPVSVPGEFARVEKTWGERTDQWYTLWLSHAPEAMVIRDRDILRDGRFSSPAYDSCFGAYAIHDCMQMNIVHAGQVMARLALYRTKGEDLFSDEEVFLLRAFGSHICLAWYNCLFGWQTGEEAGGPADLARTHGLTRREEEVLELVHQALDNPAIMARLGVSRSTLHKHLQSIYRKCGVSSRWELQKRLK